MRGTPEDTQKTKKRVRKGGDCREENISVKGTRGGGHQEGKKLAFGTTQEENTKGNYGKSLT